MGVLRKGVKLREVVRLVDLPTILTKERKFGLQRMINWGKGTRRYVGELMEDEGYFSKVCLHRLISVLIFHFQRLQRLQPRDGGRGQLHKGKLMPHFETDKWRAENSSWIC